MIQFKSNVELCQTGEFIPKIFLKSHGNYFFMLLQSSITRKL